MSDIKYFLPGRKTISLTTNAITGGVRLRTDNIRSVSPQEANESFLCFYVYLKVMNLTSLVSLDFIVSVLSRPSLEQTTEMLSSAPPFPQASRAEAETHEAMTG